VTATAAFDLHADCARCAALCCVALAFDRGEDFALDKPAQTPCPHLDAGFACTIHDTLNARGFSGCACYDCLGAGQRVTQDLFGGRDWRSDPALLGPMSEAFARLRQVHKDLDLLLAARALPLPDATRAGLDALIARHMPTPDWTPETLAAFAATGAPAAVSRFLHSLRDQV
jgi:hypothetical protein